MKNPPCIRNLDRFKKTGCPQKEFENGEGCSCWKELIVADRSNPLDKKTRKMCIDLWMFEFSWAATGFLEGNQQAINKLHNGLVMQDENGKDVPKPDMLTFTILRQAFKPSRRINIDMAAKRIEDESLLTTIENKEETNDA
jgi:hypothetical protein